MLIGAVITLLLLLILIDTCIEYYNIKYFSGGLFITVNIWFKSDFVESCY